MQPAVWMDSDMPRSSIGLATGSINSPLEGKGKASMTSSPTGARLMPGYATAGACALSIHYIATRRSNFTITDDLQVGKKEKHCTQYSVRRKGKNSTNGNGQTHGGLRSADRNHHNLSRICLPIKRLLASATPQQQKINSRNNRKA